MFINFLWGKVVIYQNFFVPLQRFLIIMAKSYRLQAKNYEYIYRKY